MNKKSEVNITAGQILNKYSKNKQKGLFIPFNEDLSTGIKTYPIFNNDFIKHRTKSLNVSKETYLYKLRYVFEFISNIDKYNSIVLWFGYEPFCQVNLLGALTLLEQYKFNGQVNIMILDEDNNNQLLRSYENVKLGKYTKEYILLINNKILTHNYSLL